MSFNIDAADVDETALPGEPPDALACRLCRSKAAAVAARHPGATVLAADTMVALDDMLLGKPADALDAAAMLRLLRGRTHQVYTAVCVANDGSLASQLSISDVTMRPYSDAEIAAYVATGDPLDKAGAYAIQHPVFAPVAAWGRLLRRASWGCRCAWWQRCWRMRALSRRRTSRRYARI